jgi:hypothetical protein
MSDYTEIPEDVVIDIANTAKSSIPRECSESFRHGWIMACEWIMRDVASHVSTLEAEEIERERDELARWKKDELELTAAYNRKQEVK